MSSDEWQPISTAPRDGTRILAWAADDGGIAVVEWREAYEWLAGNVRFTDPARFAVVHDAEDVRWTEYTPTHWRPLPPPPKDAADGR